MMAASDLEARSWQRVAYVCPGGHNAHGSVCEPGDTHAPFIAEVQGVDADGLPLTALLAVLVPGLPTREWVRASHASRTPGQAGDVTRLYRGAPPDTRAYAGAGSRTPGQVAFQLDFPLGTWHVGGEYTPP